MKCYKGICLEHSTGKQLIESLLGMKGASSKGLWFVWTNADKTPGAKSLSVEAGGMQDPVRIRDVFWLPGFTCTE